MSFKFVRVEDELLLAKNLGEAHFDLARKSNLLEVVVLGHERYKIENLDPESDRVDMGFFDPGDGKDARPYGYSPSFVIPRVPGGEQTNPMKLREHPARIKTLELWENRKK